MSATEIEKKQELLKVKKRELISRCGSAALIIAVLTMIQLSLVFLFADHSIIYAFVQPLMIGPQFSLVVLIWTNAKLIPIGKEIRELKTKIKEATSAQWREKVESKIFSGEIKPNPNLQ